MTHRRRRPRPPQPRLAGELLLSHLSVAVIGLGMLLITLASTYGMRAQVTRVSDEVEPVSQASLRVLAGVRSSIAELGGWVSLGEPGFLGSWATTWRNDIEPALATLRRHRQLFSRIDQQARLDQLQTVLADLRESQWWVQDVARTPGNEPARLTYQSDAEDIIRNLETLFGALLTEKPPLSADPVHQLLSIQFAEAQNAFASAHLLLREILGPQGPTYEPRLRQQLDQTGRLLDQLTRRDGRLTAEQQHLLALIRSEWQAFTTFAGDIVRQRNAPDWNVARRLLVSETLPLANRATELATALAADAAALMDHEVASARLATVVTLWLLVALIATMVLVAYGVSRRHAETLAQPLAVLSEATQKLADGKLTSDLPVNRADEIGDLTRAFNSMRASLLHAQTELRAANVLLERRVAERTSALEQANRVLKQEIVDRQAAEIALRQSEARLRAVVSAVPDMLFVLDEDGVYQEVLTPHHHLFRGGAGSLQGRRLHEVHRAEKADYLHNVIRQALATQRIQVAEYELATTTGPRWFESHTAPVETPAGEPRRVVVVARDVTQRKAAEEQLRQAQRMEALGHLTGGVAHDFNNLLAIVVGNLELLHEQLAPQPASQDLVRRALAAAERGANLTQRLLAFSRKQPLQAQPTSLNDLVNGMLDLLGHTLGEHIQIRTVLDKSLWPALVDPTQLESALLNLAVNARDAMPEGGTFLIETANDVLDASYVAAYEDLRPGPYVLLAVSDTGVGMSREVLEHAFEPFYTTKGLSKGSGLGLSMVYGLVKQSEGHITLYSESGRGTTIRLYLPRAPLPANVPRLVEPPEPTPPRGQAETILVVEDDSRLRKLAVAMLASLGYRILEAASAQDALYLLASNPQVALLFTDVVLPGGMDGAALAQAALAQRPNLKVLYTSGYTEQMLIQNGQLPAGAELIAKPYRKSSLASKLREVLGGGLPG